MSAATMTDRCAAAGTPARATLRVIAYLTARRGDRQWDAAIRVTGVLVLLCIPVALFVPAAEPYLLLFLATFWMRGPGAALMPVGLEPVLMLFGQLYPPWVVMLVAALASAIAEVVSIHLARGVVALRALERARGAVQASWVMRAFDRSPFFSVAFAALSPIPDWITRGLAAVSGYPVVRYVLADTVGRVPKLWLVAALGLVVHVPTRVLASVAGGSVAAGVVVALWKLCRPARGRRRHAASGGDHA